MQVVEIVSVILLSLFLMFPIVALHEANLATGGIGGRALPAPQAGLMAQLAKGIVGGQMAWGLIGVGAAFVLMRGGMVALVRRPPKGLLGGMLGLPTTDWRAKPWPTADALAQAPAPASWRRLGEIEHTFTHFALTLDIYCAEAGGPDPDLIWLPVERALAEMPSVFNKGLRLATR